MSDERRAEVDCFVLDFCEAKALFRDAIDVAAQVITVCVYCRRVFWALESPLPCREVFRD